MENPRIFAVWKPKGPTSHDVVNLVRRVSGERRVGHAGTLDPLAEGILVVGVGREATKDLHISVAAEKEYVVEVRFGMESTTDDEEGKKKEISPDASGIPTYAKIEKTLHQFIGRIEQVPPAFSAIKVGGKAAYKSAREGNVLKLKPRKVEIKKIELMKYEWPTATLRVACGSGTYIRSLARDLGRALGVGGYVAKLIRTRVGEFDMASAVPLEKLSEFWDSNSGIIKR